MWGEEEDEEAGGCFSMGSDGRIRQAVGIAMPVMSVVTTSVMRWADQEVLFDSREDDDLAVLEPAKTVRSCIAAKKATMCNCSYI